MDSDKNCLVYGIFETPFGYVGLAMREGALCYGAFFKKMSKPPADIFLVGGEIYFVENAMMSDFLFRFGWSGIEKKKDLNVLQKYADWIVNPDPEKTISGLQFWLSGTPFQVSVWRALLTVEFGTTISYEELAAKAGNPTAVRAVASAVADNPIAFFIPCHRVIRKSGEIGEYRWGQSVKRKLLAHEQKWVKTLAKDEKARAKQVSL